jgi:hypothetical protein
MIIEVKTPHSLDLEEVKSRLLKGATEIQNQYKEVQDLSIDWQEYNFKLKFKVMGLDFNGSGKILEKELISNLELKGIAKLFSKRIKNGMETQLNQILS